MGKSPLSPAERARATRMANEQFARENPAIIAASRATDELHENLSAALVFSLACARHAQPDARALARVCAEYIAAHPAEMAAMLSAETKN